MSQLLLELPSRKPQPGCYVSCISLHPTEPLILIGLSNGELCVYVSRTDGMTALLEYQEGLAALSSSSSDVKVPPPPEPAKVIRVDSQGCGLRHCFFVQGREDDLVRDVVQPLTHTAPSSSTASPAATSAQAGQQDCARHLAVCISERNSVYLLDVHTNAQLLHWDATHPFGTASARPAHHSSPLSPHRVVVHAANYGPLLFLTTADRPARASGADPVVFLCHLAATNPFLPVTTDAPVYAPPQDAARASPAPAASCGAYALALHSSYSGIKSSHERKLLKRQRTIQFLRAHPFGALLLVGTDDCVYVFTHLSGASGSGKKVQPHAMLSTREALLGSSSSSPPSSASAATGVRDSVRRAGAIIDANFLPTEVVLDADGNGGIRNLQVAVLTAQRASIIDLSYAQPMESGALDEQVFCTPVASVSAAARAHTVMYSRLYTWLGSPSSLIVQQNDGVVLEYSRNGASVPMTRVLAVRSKMQWPRLIPTARPPSTGGAGTPQLGGLCRRTLERLAALPALPSMLPLWGVLDRFPSDPQALAASPTASAEGERRLLFSRPTGCSRVIVAKRTANYLASAARPASALYVESLVASTDIIDCSAIHFSAVLSRVAAGPRDGGAAAAASGAGGDRNSSSGSSTADERASSFTLPVGAMLLDAPVRLVAFHHGLYFPGGSPDASDGFLVAGLCYAVEDDDARAHDGADADGTENKLEKVRLETQRLRRPVSLRVALVSLGVNEALVSQHPERIRARVVDLPTPASPSGQQLELLSVSYQFSNDTAPPGVWALWADPSSASSPLPSSSSPPGCGDSPVSSPSNAVLTFHGYYIPEETSSVTWHRGRETERVHITDPLYQHPSQVFALSTVGGLRGCWPLEPPAVSVLLLYYEETEVLVLGAVERGEREVAPRLFGARADSDAGNDKSLFFRPQVVVEIGCCWAPPDATAALGGDGRRGRPFPSSGHHHGGDGGAIQLTATLAPDRESLLVAVASREKGIAVLRLPIISRRVTSPAAPLELTAPSDADMARAVLSGGSGRRRSSTSVLALAREQILFARRWADMNLVRPTGIAAGDERGSDGSNNDDDSDDDDSSSSGGSSPSASRRSPQASERESGANRLGPRRGSRASVTSTSAAGRSRNALAMARRMRVFAPVSLLEWVFSCSADRVALPATTAGGPTEAASVPTTLEPASSISSAGSPRGGARPALDPAAVDPATVLASSAASAVPFLAFQRHRNLYAVHLSGGAVVQLCPALNSSVPIGVAYSFTSPPRAPPELSAADAPRAASDDRLARSDGDFSRENGGGGGFSSAFEADGGPNAAQVERRDDGDDDNGNDDSANGSDSNSVSASTESGEPAEVNLEDDGGDTSARGSASRTGRRDANRRTSPLSDASQSHGNLSVVARGSTAPHGPSAVLRVSLLYGDYLAAISQALRSRQARQQSFLHEGASAVAIQRARTNTVASPFWLVGSRQLKAKSKSGEGGSGSAAEGAAARARLAAVQLMQETFTEVRHQLSEAARAGHGAHITARHRAEGISGTRAATAKAAAAAAVAEMIEDGISADPRERGGDSGGVFHMDITETLRTAILKMQAVTITQSITDLVTSSVLFSQYIRDTFAAFTRHVQTAVIFGSVSIAEILAVVPLASVTYCLSHEVRQLAAQQRALFDRWAARTAASRTTPVADQSTAGSVTELLVAQRTRRQWWMLLMRSYAVVSLLNPSDSEESLMAVQQALQVAPAPLHPLKNCGGAASSSATYTEEVIAELLLYCPFNEQPSELWTRQAGYSPGRGVSADAQASSATCQPPMLIQAVFRALELLGASPAILKRRVARAVDDGADAGNGKRRRGGDGAAPAGPTASSSDTSKHLREAVASVPMDGDHWLSAVMLSTMISNLHAIGKASGGGDAASHSGESPPRGLATLQPSESCSPAPCAMIADYLASEIEAVRAVVQAMECVLEVARSTTAALCGVPYADSQSRAGASTGEDRASADNGVNEEGYNDHSSSQTTPTTANPRGAGASVGDADRVSGDTNDEEHRARRAQSAAAAAAARSKDEQRKQRMNVAVAESTSLRRTLLAADGADDGESATAARAAAAWRKLEDGGGLEPITASTLRADKRAAGRVDEPGGAGRRQSAREGEQVSTAPGPAAAAAREGTGDTAGAQHEEYFEQDAGPSMRLEQLRNDVYARQWRALFDRVAYPAGYLPSSPFAPPRSHRSAASRSGYPLSMLPWQVHPPPSKVTSPPAVAVSIPPPMPSPAPSSSIGQQQQQQAPVDVSVSRRVVSLEVQQATVREAYAFRTDPSVASAAASDGASSSGGGGAVAGAAPSAFRRGLAEGNYKSRFDTASSSSAGRD